MQVWCDWQVTLCDPHLSALEVRFSRRCAIQIDVYLYLTINVSWHQNIPKNVFAAGRRREGKRKEGKEKTKTAVNFGLPGPFRSRVMSRHATNRQTDGQKDTSAQNKKYEYGLATRTYIIEMS